MRVLVIAVISLMGLLFLSAETLAAPAITISPKSGPPGTVVTISGTGFESNKDIDILFEDQATGVTTKTGANGSFTVKLPIATDAQPGHYAITAREHSDPLILATAIFKVEATWRQFHGNDATHTGVNRTENTINATNAPTLVQKWVRKVGPFGVTNTPVVGDGKVWVGGRDGKFYGFDYMTGAPANGFPVQVGNNDYFDRGAAVVTPQGVFVGGEQGWLYGFNPKNGDTLQNYPIHLSSYYFGSLSYRNGKAFKDGKLYVGSIDGKLAGFQASTGMPLPHFPMQLDGGLYGALTVDNAGHGFIGTSAGSFYGIDLTAGSPVWTFNAGSVVTSTAALSQGQLFFGSDSGKVFGLDAATGAQLPNSPFTAGDSVGSSPAVDGGKVCFGSFDKYIRCLGRRTLKALYRRLARSQSWGSFEIANGLIIANDATTVYVIDLNTGKSLWQHAVNIGETSSPIVVNGILIVASTDGFLRAYAPPQPANGRDAAH